ncbi:MAG: hypothetical protein B7X89_00400 [Sulfuricurvum sp. 17-40-25]|nr:MAG: hypothetical protein B7Y30_00520 [Campylobacterales bacterium 16-40-21]OZA04050.1 MAG: hypothetical protein B7X89_00400 [Sulfuricurvum sp. 17-40-25]
MNKKTIKGSGDNYNNVIIENTGGQGKPLGYTQLSIGANMHISNIVTINLSIKNPLPYALWRTKKKAKG